MNVNTLVESEDDSNEGIFDDDETEVPLFDDPKVKPHTTPGDGWGDSDDEDFNYFNNDVFSHILPDIPEHLLFPSRILSLFSTFSFLREGRKI